MANIEAPKRVYRTFPKIGRHICFNDVSDGNPLPTFMGEPERVLIPHNIDDFTNGIWENLDENNKISLYVRYTNLESGAVEARLINKNK